MIYVNNEFLSVTEALAQLADKNKHSHEIFKVSCDVKISSKCRNVYFMEFRRIFKVLNQNDNKIVCLFCSRTLKFSNRNNPNTKYNINDNYFNTIDCPEKAYLLGWIASDGHIGKRGFRISIHQRDINTLTLLRNLICKDVPIKKFTTESSEMCSFEINSQQISRDLCNLLSIKPGKKDNTVGFPCIDVIYITYFIRGYFEGDGSVNDPDCSKFNYIKGNIRSNSDIMLNGILNYCNLNCKITCNMISLSNKVMYKFMSFIYSDRLDLTLDRKLKRFNKWKNKNEKFARYN